MVPALVLCNHQFTDSGTAGRAKRFGCYKTTVTAHLSKQHTTVTYNSNFVRIQDLVKVLKFTVNCQSEELSTHVFTIRFTCGQFPRTTESLSTFKSPQPAPANISRHALALFKQGTYTQGGQILSVRYCYSAAGPLVRSG